MEKIILIADDITGACDSGVQFTQKGLKAAVFFDEPAVGDVEADVIIYDTDSRALSQQEAYQAVDRVAATLSEEVVGMIYKKIDSTLRGNIGSEIDGLMDRLSFDVAIIVPALPSMGRITKNGIHYLNGEPIEKTEIAQDPKTPVTESNIIRLLSNQSKREASLFPKDLLNQDIQVIYQKAKELINEEKTLFVIDAENKRDLQQIVTGFKDLPFRVLWVGSAGLAEFLVPKNNGEHKRPVGREVVNNKQPVLIVSGSRSSVAKRQVETLQELSSVNIVSLIPDNLLEKEERELEIVKCQEELIVHLKNKQDVVVNVEKVQRTSLSKHPNLPYVIVEALGKIVKKAVSQFQLQGIILTGGDTAKSISRELGVTGIELIDEVERGLPLSRMIGGPRLLTVTKAGAFGSEMSLYNALQQLKGEGNQ
ncbi:four-carbon acid sugar kinase family protein [Neobacillus rhizosphaerae]|uniref:four-carbon acid sugar kinase family protein n=1 Tax=Neobacillus rhizosphaerae TaxID=2880965 RepID=UPI003D2B8DC2